MKYPSEMDVTLFILNVDAAANAVVKMRHDEDCSEAFRAQWDADIKEAKSDTRPQVSHAEVLAESKARWTADIEEDKKIQTVQLAKVTVI